MEYHLVEGMVMFTVLLTSIFQKNSSTFLIQVISLRMR
ncbi:Uncharacterised protein [Serratia fonticola]|nr:Uncharacterised protein [Serratia fonticola]